MVNRKNMEDYREYTEAQIQAAANVNLVDFCAAYGIPLKKFSGNTYQHVDYSSLKITGSRWIRYSEKTQSGSFTKGNAIHFAREYMELDFKEAVGKLLEFAGYSPEPEREGVLFKLETAKAAIESEMKQQPIQKNKQRKEQQPKEVQAEAGQPPKEAVKFELPEKNEDMKRLFGYLTQTRQIDAEVVKEVVRRGSLYEEAKHHNCVFIGFDKNNTPKYGALKGTFTEGGKVFTGEVGGSKKQYGWCYTPANKSGVLRVYESPIDALSHMSIDKAIGSGWKNKHYLSLGGTSGKALEYYLSMHKEITNVTFCLDNDESGRNATQKLMQQMQEARYTCTNSAPSKHNDYNDMLVAKKKQVELTR